MIRETAEDRAAQEHIAEQVSAAWLCDVKPFPPLSEVDYYLEREGAMVAVLEVKHHLRRRPLVLISARKWLALWEVSHRCHVPALIAIGYPDGVAVAEVHPRSIERVGQGGRTDRGAVHDVELCVWFRVAPLRVRDP